jgi:CubicO group peptidase (beta-lactamase class C family)
MTLINYGRIIFLLSLLITYSCTNSTEQVSDINTQQIDEAFSDAQHIPGLKSLIVNQRGNILKEQYFGSAVSEQEFDIHSVTKSITSILIGIAIDKGYIQSVDQKINEFIAPPVATVPSDKSGITIRHLLTMTGGFPGDESAGSDTTGDEVSYILNVPLIHQPGEQFRYDSRAYHLLSVILTSATGMSTKTFAAQYLFSPLGIGNKTWMTDSRGYFIGSSGLFLTGRDMVKIGELLLNEGMYNGTRVVASNWTAQLKQVKVSTLNGGGYATGYSFGFWIGDYYNRNYSFAMGWGGQFIFVVPSLNLVITAASNPVGVSDAVAAQYTGNIIDLIMTRILTAFNK